MSIRKMFMGREARLARKADNLATNCELIVQKMWDLRQEYKANSSTFQHY
jgi:hypothetical protein